ncbi:MAG: hypothetical protein WBW55_02520 [Desulfobaccales bacterium]
MLNNGHILTAAEAANQGIISNLGANEYLIKYTDNTHLSEDKWIDLLRVNLLDSPRAIDGKGNQFYELEVLTKNYKFDKKETMEKNRWVLDEALSKSMLRTGIFRPILAPEVIDDIIKISQQDAVVMILDTNSLSNGTLHWLLKVLGDTQVWLFPVVVSLTQVQQHDERLKKLVGDKKETNLRTAIRSRALVNSSLGLLERLRDKYQLLEMDPQLLRYVRPSGKASSDPDEGDVLEDRLLIEAIHTIFGSTRSRTEKRVVTSDVLLARILHTEGLPTLYLQRPDIGDGPIPCLYYEYMAKAFFGSPLLNLIWDLAHSFGTIRLSDKADAEVLRLDAYWPGKTPHQWINESLKVAIPPGRHDLSTGGDLSGFSRKYSKVILPEAAFIQVLRLGGSLLEGKGTLDDLVNRIEEGHRPTERIAPMAIEILIRAGFASLEGDLVTPTDNLKLLDDFLAVENLDEANRLWTNFLPYGLYFSKLRDKGSIEISDLPLIFEDEIGGRPTIEACERFAHAPVVLGQAWTDKIDNNKNIIRDGSARPHDKTAIESFSSIFEAKERDGLCSIIDLLSDFCRSLRISPWAASKQLQHLVEENFLRDYSFQPSAGKRVAGRDYIVKGRLGGLQIYPVPLDRIQIGDRPIFTISRRSS